jgi:uncharacterized protein YkwD
MTNKKIAATLLFLLAVCLPLTSPSATDLKISALAPDLWKQDLLDRVNLLRSKGCHCGRKYMPPVAPLRWNEKLEKAASAHASDMERNHFFDHKGSNGKTSADRASKAGYKWKLVGENIAWGYESAAEVVLGWKKSSGHCRNMMHGGYTEMGAGKLGTYWVQVFGTSVKQLNPAR